MIKKITTTAIIVLLILSCSDNKEAGFGNEEAAYSSKMMVEESRIMDFDSFEEEMPAEEPIEIIETRKRIYNGDAHLIVESTTEIKDSIERVAVEVEGYVTQISQDFISIKVPAESFHEVFNRILKLGNVESKNIYTYDVTDYYQDTALELKTAEDTRTRLQQLLKISTDPKERTRILKEIGRLTEEIELIKSRLALLDLNVAFSTITVKLTPRLSRYDIQRQNPFPWIANISPLYPASYKLDGKLKYNPGTEYAVFNKEKYYYAENSTGTSIRISTVENHPTGNSDFWRNALEYYLQDYYISYKFKEFPLGDREIIGIEFLSRDTEPFKYFIGLIVEKDKVHVLEIYSPEGSESLEPIYKSFEKGELK